MDKPIPYRLTDLAVERQYEFPDGRCKKSDETPKTKCHGGPHARIEIWGRPRCKFCDTDIPNEALFLQVMKNLEEGKTDIDWDHLPILQHFGLCIDCAIGAK